MTDNARSWLVRKRRCSLTCVKPLRSFTGRYGRSRRLPTQVGHTTVPRKLCSMNCASVLASCGSQVRCNSKRIGWQLGTRFGNTSGIKRVKLATLVYRNQLSSGAILTESNKEVDGNNRSPSPPQLRAGYQGRSRQSEKLF